VTQTQTQSLHPLAEKHAPMLAQAREALAARSFFSRYPESPSPRVYGETAAAEGQSAFEGALGEDFRGLGDQPTDGSYVGSEVSPYGPKLRVRYPRLDVDAAVAAAQAAMPAWRDAGALTRAAVCVEIVDAINKRSFEMANAVMHTTGQPFVMAFQAAGPHAQDRALEAVVAALVEQERVPSSVVWEKPAKGEPIRMQKDYRIVPRGIALVIGCNTFPTWNGYPGLFASLATGNPVIVKPHPRAVLPLALNSIVVDSTDNLRGVLGNLAFSLTLYSGQMCTTPQNIYVPREGIDTDEGHVSFADFGDKLGMAIGRLTGEDAKAVRTRWCAPPDWWRSTSPTTRHTPRSASGRSPSSSPPTPPSSRWSGCATRSASTGR
jgi:hypothetical protein